jgi:hypothetical protein
MYMGSKLVLYSIGTVNYIKQALTPVVPQPESMQLRYLQTLTEIAGEKNSTIVFPLPVDMLETFQKMLVRN